MITLRTLLWTALSGLMALVASPVLALSCIPYSPRHAFQDASASPDRYVVAHGQLDFDPALLPVVDMARQADTPPDTFFGASLTGFSLTGSGFNARMVQQIQVNVQCYGPWCAGLGAGQEYLMFLKQTDAGYLLETNPCGGYAFQDPTPETLHDMHQCLLGEECAPPDF